MCLDGFLRDCELLADLLVGKALPAEHEYFLAFGRKQVQSLFVPVLQIGDQHWLVSCIIHFNAFCFPLIVVVEPGIFFPVKGNNLPFRDGKKERATTVCMQGRALLPEVYKQFLDDFLSGKLIIHLAVSIVEKRLEIAAVKRFKCQFIVLLADQRKDIFIGTARVNVVHNEDRLGSLTITQLGRFAKFGIKLIQGCLSRLSNLFLFFTFLIKN